MKHLILITGAALTLSALQTAQAKARDAASVACPASGPDSPLELHEAWILQGWERRDGDPEYDFAAKLGRFYDLNDRDGVFFDNFAPGASQLFDDAAVYGANWKGLQDATRTVSHGLREAGAEALVSDDVASSTLGFVGRLEQLTGQVSAFDARSQIAWRCVDGAWKIRHELNYAWPVEPATIEALLPSAPAQR